MSNLEKQTQCYWYLRQKLANNTADNMATLGRIMGRK